MTTYQPSDAEMADYRNTFVKLCEVALSRAEEPEYTLGYPAARIITQTWPKPDWRVPAMAACIARHCAKTHAPQWEATPGEPGDPDDDRADKLLNELRQGLCFTMGAEPIDWRVVAILTIAEERTPAEAARVGRKLFGAAGVFDCWYAIEFGVDLIAAIAEWSSTDGRSPRPRIAAMIAELTLTPDTIDEGNR